MKNAILDSRFSYFFSGIRYFFANFALASVNSLDNVGGLIPYQNRITYLQSFIRYTFSSSAFVTRLWPRTYEGQLKKCIMSFAICQIYVWKQDLLSLDAVEGKTQRTHLTTKILFHSYTEVFKIRGCIWTKNKNHFLKVVFQQCILRHFEPL